MDEENTVAALLVSNMLFLCIRRNFTLSLQLWFYRVLLINLRVSLWCGMILFEQDGLTVMPSLMRGGHRQEYSLRITSIHMSSSLPGRSDTKTCYYRLSTWSRPSDHLSQSCLRSCTVSKELPHFVTGLFSAVSGLVTPAGLLRSSEPSQSDSGLNLWWGESRDPGFLPSDERCVLDFGHSLMFQVMVVIVTWEEKSNVGC